MKKGDHIQLRKMSPTDAPLCASGDPISYQYGKVNLDVSVPTGYTLKGHLMTDVEVGKSVRINRYERNGKTIDGITETTPVVKILANRFYTDNSVYEVISL